MYTIYSLTPAPWGDHYRFVESFDTEEDAKNVLDGLEKVNILFNYYKIIEEDYVQTNKRLRAENRLLRRLLFASAALLEHWNPADVWFPQINEQFSKHMAKVNKVLAKESKTCPLQKEGGE